MDLELANRVVLVAGASRGIGRAIAMSFAREGARVSAIARGAEDLAALGKELPGNGHAQIVADLTTPDGVANAVTETVSVMSGLDIVVANVGKSYAREASLMDDADFQKSLEMNLWSGMRVAQACVPHLRARGGGSITLISSIWGREAGGAPGYNVAKAGVVALAKALARDYAKDNIRVNSVAPGSIMFPGGGWDKRRQADPDKIADMVKRELPFGRFGSPDEVAAAVTFLASPRASWIAGACLVVDGGQSRAF